jgi:hypothetical protein
METKIQKLILHRVGNKSNDDRIVFSKSTLDIDEKRETLLKKYFLSSIKKDEYYTLYHESDISLNEVYTYVSRIFKDQDSFFDESINIAKHLYEKSEHPKIKEGDLYIVYFTNVQVEEQIVNAIGIFKSENKDTFIKVENDLNKFDINFDFGTNINNLDKGCIVYNTEKENGFLVSIIDNLSKTGFEARYWKDDFLHVKPRKDEYYNTQNVMSLCKNFIKEGLPEELDISKADQVDFLNKAVEYFKKNEDFDMSDFKKVVMRKPEVVESFNQYQSEYEFARELAVLERFSISEAAVKKQAKALKSVIKLDKNFHIYVHGDRDMIEQGTDEEGRKYYKIYYREES